MTFIRYSTRRLMADTDPAAGEQPTGNGGGETNKGGATGVLDLDAKVKVGGKELTIKDIIAAKEAAEAKSSEYDQYKTATETLLQGDSVDAAKRSESLRHVLSKAGYAPEDIEEYVKSLDPGTSKPADNEGEKKVETTKTAPDAATAAELKQLREEMDRHRVQSLKKALHASAAEVLDSHPNMSLLFKALKDLRGEEGLAEAKNRIAEEIQRETINRLKIRSSTTGRRVEEDWLAEESQGAAEAVYKGYLSVIGDPNKLKRAPETVTGQDVLLRSKPIPTPTYEKGKDDMGTTTTKVREWNTDVLSRLALEDGEGGEGKV